MRILYGVVGEGMGHATRSRVLLEELTREHEVQIVVSGRAKDYLSKRFENVHGIWGLTLAYEGNSVKKLQTLLQNLSGAVKGWPHNIRQYFELAESFKPDVVVSDFESFSYLFGRNHRLPVISVDNMQIINRCKHEPELLAGWEDDFEGTRALVKAKLPGCFHYLATTFFYPPVRKERTSLLPSILRPEILAAKSEPGEHLLVYQTTTTNTALPDILKQSGLTCHIYGLRRDLTEDVRDGNLLYRPFSEKGFIDDLRTARAVVAGGGYTLMSEAVYLRKPMLTLPLKGQFEQVLNALYLEKLGYGMHASELTVDVLRDFLQRVPRCQEALKGYEQDGNVKMIAALREQLARAAEDKGRWWDAAERDGLVKG
ncbi:MJ1255/VC2487 family glycosyltransferase [Archangium primigenium]|uniref:MJ1255/VC2487 family glycosyltransferase n=1 Tax=[Archangium] primigenium TaxID=2792470 RepID=UPI00195A72D0|nr:MJ1255/VC2487 family glycosyltransferase [Archangium primigenium]MBM7118584.1 teichoic acid biosynthesis protein [Archangium primigenium]